jgi:hypothetical protein
VLIGLRVLDKGAPNIPPSTDVPEATDRQVPSNNGSSGSLERAPVDPIHIILLLSALVGFGLIAAGVFVMLRAPNVHQHSTASVKFVGMEMTAVGPAVLIILGIVLVYLPIYSWDKVPSVIPQLPSDSTPPVRPSSPPVASPEPTPVPTEPQPPRTAISPQDAATQLAVWESVRSNRNGLVEAYNILDLTLAKWEAYMDDASGRKSFTDGMRNVMSRLKDWFPRLDALKNEYPQFNDLTAAIANSHVDRVLEKAAALVDAVADSRQETSEARLLRLRPLEGALRTEMGGTANWLTALGRTSEQRIHDLSGVK